MGEVSPWMVASRARRTSSRCAARSAAGSCGTRGRGRGADGRRRVGLVPLMSMLRAGAPARLLVSARDPDDVLYHEELERRLDVTFTYTRWAPRGWTGYTRRVTARC